MQSPRMTAMAQTKTLSKTKLMGGLQCPKQLWLGLHRPELVPETDAATQAQFDEGNEVGAAARQYFGPGHLVETEYWDMAKGVAATQAAIKRGEKVIYEAAFQFEDFFARADI